MVNTDEEDIVIDDESSDEVDLEGLEDILGDPEEDEQPPARPNPLAAELVAVQVERDELNKRLGDLARTSGEKLKGYESEVFTWADGVQEWHNKEMSSARADAFAEGVRSVEKRLLPKLLPEEKSEYLEDARMSPESVSPRQPVKLDFKPVGRVAEDTYLTATVEGFVLQGVPLDQLDQTSVQTVVASGSKYLTSKAAAIEGKLVELEERVNSRLRDAAGATRVSSGGSSTGSSSTSKSALQKQLEQIDVAVADAKKRHDINRYTILKAKRDEVAQKIARASRTP